MDQISSEILWAILGVLFLVAELFTTTFFLLFFGISALVTALADWAGLDFLAWQLFLFAFLGSASVFFFKQKFSDSLGSKTPNLTSDTNQLVTLSNAIKKGDSGILNYQGTSWTALNIADVDLQAGEKAKIVKVDGVKLIVDKLDVI